MAITDGVPAATLQTWLAQALQAYQNLMTGAQVVSLSYGMGDGQKTVAYTRIESPKLLQWIAQLQQALNTPGSRRRALRPVF